MPITEVKRRDLKDYLVTLEKAQSKVVAVIPTMLAYFATAPERYEVTDYLIVWEPHPSE